MTAIGVILVFWYMYRLCARVEKKEKKGKKLTEWEKFWTGPATTITGDKL
jgi:hypothetical protein